MTHVIVMKTAAIQSPVKDYSASMEYATEMSVSETLVPAKRKTKMQAVAVF